MQYIGNNGDRIIEHFTNKKAVREFHPTGKGMFSLHITNVKQKKRFCLGNSSETKVATDFCSNFFH